MIDVHESRAVISHIQVQLDENPPLPDNPLNPNMLRMPA